MPAAAETTPLLNHNISATLDSSCCIQSPPSRTSASTEEEALNNDEFASSPVTVNHAWIRVALVFVAGALSLPSLVTGVVVFAALAPSPPPPFAETTTTTATTLLVSSTAAIVCGNVILASIASLTGILGSRTRRNLYSLASIAFGQYGATFLNGIFCLALVGWFGVNLNLFSRCILKVALLDSSFQEKVPSSSRMLDKIVEVVGGLVITLTTIHGIWALEILSIVLAPLLAIVALVLIVKSCTTLTTEVSIRGIHAINRGQQSTDPLDASKDELVVSTSMTFGQAVSSVVGLSIIGAVIMPDYTRFIRQAQGAVYSAFLAFAITASLVQFAGGIASVAFQNDDLLEVLVRIGWKWEALVVVTASSWILNAMNLYSAALSFEATLPNVQSRLCVILLGLLGTAAAFANILDSFLSFLYYLSITFAPVAAVIATDCIVLRPSRYSPREEETLSNRVAVKADALLAWTLGVAIAILGSTDIIPSTGIGTVDSLFVSAISYCMMNWLLRVAR